MRNGLNLSTRLTIAIVPLVVLTAASVGYLGYRNLATVAIGRTLAAIDTTATSRAIELASLVKNVRADVTAFRAAIGLGEMTTLSRNPSLQTTRGWTLAEWRAGVGQRLAGELEAKPDLLKYRLIGLADGGRELVRVERQRNGAVRVVPDEELQRASERDLFAQAINVAEGKSIVSPVELDQDHGATTKPHVPVIRVSAPVFGPDGTQFGLIVAHIDLRAAFDRVTGLAQQGRVVYVINNNGDYLLHPDKTREFGFELGRPARIQDDFPALVEAIAKNRERTSIVEDRNGTPFGVALEHADGVALSIVETIPQRIILDAIMTAWLSSTLLGCAFAVLIAIGLALVMARTMTRPLSQMTAAVSSFADDRPIDLPLATGGEIGVLARAFQKMALDSRDKTAAIRREKEIFERIMNAMAEAVLLIDRKGQVIYESPGAVKLRSPTPGRPVRPWAEAIDSFLEDGVTPLPPDRRPGQRALQGETVDQIELVLHVRDAGRNVEVIGNAQPIRNAAGRINGAVVVYKDVTELKEAERRLHQAQKLEAIGQLTGGVAHDFNNMLTVISGTAEILLEELTDRPNLSNIAKMIEQAAERGADLTRQLLAFARKQPLQPRNVDVNAIVLETEQLLRATIGEHIQVDVRLEQDVDAARIDPSQLSSALLNLAVNARDAMPISGKLLLETGGVVLDNDYAQQNPDVRPGRYVMIAVSDTGTGIPAEMRDKVFEPFFTTKSLGNGTGLGLSIVYGFVKQSGGHVKIYSEENQGTTIKLYLPRTDAAIDSAPIAAPVVGGSETILLVEDDELVRQFAIAQLQGLGYRTIAVCDGPSALKEVERGAAFDLLFTDVIMPGGLNGPQLAEAVARIRPVRVLFTSGYTENAILHHGRLDPGALLLSKPYRRSDLARMVRAALDQEYYVPAEPSACAVAAKSPDQLWPSTDRAAGA
ncbi:ATP-binding protein [Rhodopseudomonas pseudopalustris]|uniref:histidine kinase n=1 Tax=Rhodopseudomonas pseudopalustris TaxID=1513892 RepID=A0A1H8RVX4_9BRAD|nr:ATP-binding protein [Rhodopseudomonas pseudopalustris]SEO70799.1 PAS domain S-box-containing protein [Rhodopseudomonas pseudopalustris]